MKRIPRYGLMLLAVLMFAAAPQAWAFCNFETQIVGHTLGGWIVDCPDDNPIEGYAWLLSSPGTVNSGGQEFVCRSDAQSIPISGISCGNLPGSGVDGDDIVTVYIEWGVQNQTIPGCPNATQDSALSNPLGVQVICNNGASALFQIGYFGGLQQYALELSGPATGEPVAASHTNSGLTVVSVGAGPTPSASNVCVNVQPPVYNSDCDPTALGFGAEGSCANPSSRPAAERGTLMQFTGPCDVAPDLRSAAWTQTLVQPDATGAACNVFDGPAGTCTYAGVRSRSGGVDGSGIIGWVKVGNLASNDRVKIDSATAAQGKVKVAFSTTNETSIVGFNVYSDGAKLNSSLIASKGVGNNAYVYEVGRGALKGGKSVIVEAVKNDGTVEKTAPVSLK